MFDDARLPRPLSGLPTHHTEGSGDIAGLLDALAPRHRRLVVVGDDADLAAVLTGLLHTDRLDVEVGYAPPTRTRGTRAYGLSAGLRAARRARHGTARRVPLIRDDTGSVIVGRAGWLPAESMIPAMIRGEAIVDDTVLFDGAAAAVWIEPTLAPPGLRACVPDGRPWRRWVAGRAAQLGTTGAAVVRDGIAAPRTVRRSTFYRNVEGWLLVR